jgi:hypothetical protein
MDEESAGPVVIGRDPHKRTVTIEVMTTSEEVVGHGRFTTDEAGFAALLVVDLERVYAREEDREQGAHRADLDDRDREAGAARHRTLRRRPAAGRGRGCHPVPTKGHFASWNGAAPIDASSGDNARHGLACGGPAHQPRPAHDGRRAVAHENNRGPHYYDRKTAAGNRPNEAMRCLKRRLWLSDIVYRTMLDDARPQGRAREDTGARHSYPARPAHSPNTDTSDQSLPGPVAHQARTPIKTAA